MCPPIFLLLLLFSLNLGWPESSTDLSLTGTSTTFRIERAASSASKTGYARFLWRPCSRDHFTSDALFSQPGILSFGQTNRFIPLCCFACPTPRDLHWPDFTNGLYINKGNWNRLQGLYDQLPSSNYLTALLTTHYIHLSQKHSNIIVANLQPLLCLVRLIGLLYCDFTDLALFCPL